MKVLSTIMLLLTGALLFGQHAREEMESFNYQAVLRHADGELMKGQMVNVLLSIKKGGSGGLDVFAETHKVVTDQYGLISLEVGAGDAVMHTLSEIDWSQQDFWLNISIDTENGTNYRSIGATKIMSVPFALQAGKAAEVTPALYQELRGNQWTEGTTDPANGAIEALPGDYYLNVSTAEVFKKEENGTWAYRGTLNPETGGDNRDDPNDWTTSGNSGTDPASNFIGTTDNNGLAFRINNTEEMRLTGKGLVIGQTSVPNNHVLTLRQQADDKFSGMKIINASNTRYARFFVGSNGTVFDAQNGTFMLRNFNQDRFFMDLDGNVGIGTKTPAKLLDVDGDALISGTLEVNTTNGGVLFPRLTTAERDVIIAANGTVIFNSTDQKLQGFVASEEVDQSMEEGTGSSWFVNSTNSPAQSFTAGISGDLTKIAINIVDFPGSTYGSITMKIFDGDGVGGTVLLTDTVGIPTFGEYEYTLSSSVAVTSGNSYTIQLSTIGIESVYWMLETGDPLPGGMRYVNTTSYPGHDHWFKATVLADRWKDLH